MRWLPWVLLLGLRLLPLDVVDDEVPLLVAEAVVHGQDSATVDFMAIAGSLGG
jgi:hypothetical protein